MDWRHYLGMFALIVLGAFLYSKFPGPFQKGSMGLIGG